ncbi:MAG: Asp-tRNA(Asn)/Glu-tRNA(Gln) amidotransferase subunit GatA [Hyphomicrobiales bacterium]
MDSNLAFSDYNHLRDLFNSRALKVIDMLELFIRRIKEKTHLNAFVEVFVDKAREQALESDLRFVNKNPRPLEGLIVALKDNILYKGFECTAASDILKGFIAPYNASIVEYLLEAGVIIIGRTNCDEFAMGSTGEHSCYGAVLNPLNPEFLAGGSSSGSAAAVAAGLCTVALGSDTGGSIRLPASWCGVIGMKPTYGRVSRYGLIAYANSMDQIGPIARTVDDLAVVLETIIRKDRHDHSMSIKNEGFKYIKEEYTDVKFIKIKEFDEDPNLNPYQKKAINDIEVILKSKGYSIDLISFPDIQHIVKAFQLLSSGEASSNLAKYDGIRYGASINKGQKPIEIITNNRSALLGKEPKRKIIFGSYALHSDNYDNYYKKALQYRELIKDFIEKHLQNNHILLTPTSPIIGAKKGETEEFFEQYSLDFYTVIANMSGTPSVSIPVGYAKNGLPLSIQLTGYWANDNQILNIAQMICDNISL